MIIQGFPDRIIVADGKEYHYFGGTSYLGMATHPEFLELLSISQQQWGTAYGSSRSSNTILSIYIEAERFLAEKTGMEDAAVVSSGTLAGKIVTGIFMQKGLPFYHYPKTHPAVMTAGSIPVIDKNGQLHPSLLEDNPQSIIITADAIPGLATAPVNFSFLNNIHLSKKVTLILDESHSMGITGDDGWGISRDVKSDRLDRIIMVSSLAKAMGVSGGLIASDKEMVNMVKEHVLFISSSAANPAYLNAMLKAEDIYIRQREKLKRNLAFIKRHLRMQPMLHFNENYPVIYAHSDTIFATLQREKIIISSFKYPTYETRMNRMVISANHTPDDIKKLIDILNSF